MFHDPKPLNLMTRMTQFLYSAGDIIVFVSSHSHTVFLEPRPGAEGFRTLDLAIDEYDRAVLSLFLL